MSEFFSGSLDPFWPHVVLLITAVAASFAVAAGIVLENPKWSLANGLVVGGVAIEAACTLLLFGFDEGISRAQQETISSQQRTIEQLLTKRKLNAAQKDRIAKAIKRFPPIAFISYTNPEAEPWDFALDISATLKADGWDWKPFPPPAIGLQALDGRPAQGMTIADHIEIQGAPEMKAVADALADALRDQTVIGMEDVRSLLPPKGYAT
jgi:hypothetical protein